MSDKAEFSFKILGAAIGQGRPRFSVINGHARAYDPAKSREQKQTVKAIIMQAMMEQGFKTLPPEAHVSVSIASHRAVPESKSKRFKKMALEGLIKPNTKPDCDNVIKLYLDAMSKLVYADDKQIYLLKYDSEYSEEAYTEIKVEGYIAGV